MSYHWVARLAYKATNQHLQDRGAMYAIAAAMSLALALIPDSNVSRSKRFVMLLVACFMMFSVLFQHERVGYLVLLVLVAYVFWWRYKWRGLIMAGIAIFVLSVFGYSVMPKLGFSNLNTKVNSLIHNFSAKDN
ncbi:MAG: hypothetical protein ABGY11_11355, partial [Candidatus Thioglobus sp.]